MSGANALAAAAAAASVYPVHQDPLQEQADVNGYAQRQQNRHTKQVHVSFKIANVECLKTIGPGPLVPRHGKCGINHSENELDESTVGHLNELVCS